MVVREGCNVFVSSFVVLSCWHCVLGTMYYVLHRHIYIHISYPNLLLLSDLFPLLSLPFSASLLPSPSLLSGVWSLFISLCRILITVLVFVIILVLVLILILAITPTSPLPQTFFHPRRLPTQRFPT